MEGDVVQVLEAAYAPSDDVERWLNTVVTAARPLMDGGLGINAHAYAYRDDGRVDLASTIVTLGMPDADHLAYARHIFDAMNAQPAGRDALARLYPRAPAAGSFSERSGLALDGFGGPAAGPRLAEALGIIAGNPDGHGVVLFANRPRMQRLPPSERILWTRVATHLASAYRLLRSQAANEAQVDAVLTPTGKLEHLEHRDHGARMAAANGVFQDHARAIDRARGRLRRANPEEALALWTGLVGGEWTLVDHVDADGKRHLFARRNAPRALAWRTLTTRERQVLAYAAVGQSHKAIAYALGIGVPTVSKHLVRAARKVGAPSRLAMIQAYRRETSGVA